MHKTCDWDAGVSTERIVKPDIWRTAVIYDEDEDERKGRKDVVVAIAVARVAAAKETERDSSRNCIGICMAISILELTYLEMFSLAEIHGRLLRLGAPSLSMRSFGGP